MPNITIRNLEASLVAGLKAQAKSHRRSLEAEVRQILADAVRHPSRGSELRTLAQKIAALTPDVPQTESTELLQEDRRR